MKHGYYLIIEKEGDAPRVGQLTKSGGWLFDGKPRSVKMVKLPPIFKILKKVDENGCVIQED